MTNNTTPAPIALTCSECGEGRYYRFFTLSPVFECEECGHSLTTADVELEAGETLTTTEFGALAYIPADGTLDFLDSAEVRWGDADAVRRGYEAARSAHGDDYANYLIQSDREHNDKGIPLKPWPLSLQGNDGD